MLPNLGAIMCHHITEGFMGVSWYWSPRTVACDMTKFEKRNVLSTLPVHQKNTSSLRRLSFKSTYEKFSAPFIQERLSVCLLIWFSGHTVLKQKAGIAIYWKKLRGFPYTIYGCKVGTFLRVTTEKQNPSNIYLGPCAECTAPTIRKRWNCVQEYEWYSNNSMFCNTDSHRYLYFFDSTSGILGCENLHYFS